MDEISATAESIVRPADRSAGSEASRYFGAAAYRDRAFRRKVLAFLDHGWYRARAPEFGIDEQFVATHCRQAERRETLRNLLMLLAFCMFGFLPLLTLATEAEDASDVGLILAYYKVELICAVLAAALVLFVERLITQHYTMTRRFSRERFAGTATSAGPDADGPQNLIVYGGYSPFVGSGYGIGGWSFSVNLERTRDDLSASGAAIPFESSELIAFVGSRLDRLHIPSLQQYEALFADGRHIRAHAALLSNDQGPKRRIPLAAIQTLDDLPAAGTRSYLCISVTDWSGEIVLSVYLRCARGDSNLFVEASYFLLTPLQPAFYKIDEMDPRLRADALFGLIMQSIVTAPFMLVIGVFDVLGAVFRPFSRLSERGRIRQSMERNPRFNFGAVTSIREMGMQNYYRVYFQQLDKERHVKTIKQCTIDAIVDFLSDHNIDTSDIRDRRTAILNNGVIVSGGDLNAENLAVGKGAKAAVSRLGGKPRNNGPSAGAAP